MANNNFDDTIWQGIKNLAKCLKQGIKRKLKKQVIITEQLISYL